MRTSRSVRLAGALLTCVSMAAAAHAGTVAVPNQYASTSSGTTGLNTFIRDINNPRTGQLLIAASELTAIPVGNYITGITFRMFSGGTSFPPTNATWADYTINIAAGGPLPGSTTFANNIVGPITVCRTGSLTINANAFPVGGSPNPFGTDIDCTNQAFQYNGGNIVVEIRHTGSNITNLATHFLEAVPTTHPDYGTRFWSATATGNTATTGAVATFTVARLQVSPTPVELLSVGVE